MPVLHALVNPSLLLAITGWAQSPTADSFNPGANYYVGAFAVQPDGRVLVGGWFTNLAGEQHDHLGRLNSDGSYDATFSASAGDSYQPDVYALGLQPDGNILVGGRFNTINGEVHTCIGRLFPDGAVDSTFNPNTDGDVTCFAQQAGGKVLVGGRFQKMGGLVGAPIRRLTDAGTLDTNFHAASDFVNSIAVQANDQMVVAGATGGTVRRLNSDGSADSSFNVETDSGVRCLALQPDGKILVGGNFTYLNGRTWIRMARLNANGSLDTSFAPSPNSSVTSIALQSNGKILVCGNFTVLANQPCQRIGRLNSDGSLDNTFNPGADSTVLAMALQADGRVLAGGYFNTLGGQTRHYIGRLFNSEAATQELTFDGSTITWLRGGSSPEVWRTSFESSTNGSDWVTLGAGVRIAGGWQLTVLNGLTNATIRARGYVSGAYRNGSGWFVESFLRTVPLCILAESLDSSNGFGFTISGQPGSQVEIRASSDLRNWETVAVITNHSGNAQFRETVTNSSSRFFHARYLP